MLITSNILIILIVSSHQQSYHIFIFIYTLVVDKASCLNTEKPINESIKKEENNV